MLTMSKVGLLNLSVTYDFGKEAEAPQFRAKKRKLDHLSWEEKLQRKKLKNRVAAQTSRDRRKAKMENMELAIEKLFLRNEQLLRECETLKKSNNMLLQESKDLKEQILRLTSNVNEPLLKESDTIVGQSGVYVERVIDNGSTARCNDSLSTHFDKNGDNANVTTTFQNAAGIPSLPDLIDELIDSTSLSMDDNSLARLTDSLLDEIARDLDEASLQAQDQELHSQQTDNSPTVVEPPPQGFQPCSTEITPEEHVHPLALHQEVLLHHNYSAKPKNDDHRSDSRNCIRTENPIYAKHKNKHSYNIVDNAYPVKNAKWSGVDTDPCARSKRNDQSQIFHRSVQSSVSPDRGYESLDSPESIENTEVWDESVSELFPSLIL